MCYNYLMGKQYIKAQYNEQKQKLCTNCKNFKNFSEFHKRAKAPDGIVSYCKACVKEIDTKRNESKLKKPRKTVNNLIHCRHCEEYLDKSEFWGNDLTYCRPCKTKVGINSNLKKKGLDMESYSDMEKSQNGVCAICKNPESKKRRLSVDHDHECCPGSGSCGKCIRGLLCSNCNTAIGLMKDSVETLKAAIAYLEK